MYTYLHNPRCSKSRNGLQLMEKSGKKYELREYLKNPLDLNDLLDLQEKLGLKALDFTRTGEKEFQEAGLNKNSSDREILQAMAKFPKLMERPILYNEKKLFLGDLKKIFLNLCNNMTSITIINSNGALIAKLPQQIHKTLIHQIQEAGVEVLSACHHGICGACIFHIKEGHGSIDKSFKGEPGFPLGEDEVMSCIAGVTGGEDPIILQTYY